jgi:hypothetical protein
MAVPIPQHYTELIVPFNNLRMAATITVMRIGFITTTQTTTRSGFVLRLPILAIGIWMVTTTAVMYKGSAMLSRSKWVFGTLLGVLALHAAPTGAQRGWYFLSGTSTIDIDRHYPSFLYTGDSRNKLRVVRQIVSREDGVHSIRAYGRVAFVVYPHLPPSVVSIVHLDAPESVDEVVLNAEGEVVIDNRGILTEPSQQDVRALIWLVRPGNPPSRMVISISSDVPTKGRRVQTDAWGEYSSLRFDGVTGGPVMAPGVVGVLEKNTVGIRVPDNNYVIVDRIPNDIAQEMRGETPYFLVATGEYLAVGTMHRLADMQSGALSKRTSETLYVHDRQANRWSTITLEGTCSRTRVFGPWLATVVQFWNPNHAPNPGASNERNVETDTLPNVRELYAMFAGQNCSIPGDLALRNLRTGQTIAFHTGQEDSEVLQIEADTVLYRINDTIYQAKIVGDQLIKEPTVVVKDEDVPEIHWAFWSK